MLYRLSSPGDQHQSPAQIKPAGTPESALATAGTTAEDAEGNAGEPPKTFLLSFSPWLLYSMAGL